MSFIKKFKNKTDSPSKYKQKLINCLLEKISPICSNNNKSLNFVNQQNFNRLSSYANNGDSYSSNKIKTSLLHHSIQKMFSQIFGSCCCTKTTSYEGSVEPESTTNVNHRQQEQIQRINYFLQTFNPADLQTLCNSMAMDNSDPKSTCFSIRSSSKNQSTFDRCVFVPKPLINNQQFTSTKFSDPLNRITLETLLCLMRYVWWKDIDRIDDSEDEHDIVHMIIMNGVIDYDIDLELIWNHLQPLPWCSNCKMLSSRDLFCLNPFHWAVVLIPKDQQQKYYEKFLQQNDDSDIEYCSQTITIPSSSTNSLSLWSKFCDHKQTSDISSTTTTQMIMKPKTKWCKLSYWQYKDRLLSNKIVMTVSKLTNGGRLVDMFQIDKPFIDKLLDSEVPKNQISSLTNTAQISKTINKMEVGVIFFRFADNNADGDDVWLYNCSKKYPVFVERPCLPWLNDINDKITIKDQVIKVNPGQLIKIHNGHLSQLLQKKQLLKQSSCKGVDFNSIRFSFAKGFGHNYKRSDIMCCPCWFEVFLFDS